MLPYQTIPQKENGIAIVGIGGAGANILQCFGGSSADNVHLYTMSLDERIGRGRGSNVRFIQLGGGLNHGLGSGGDPEVGRNAAEESAEELNAMLENTRLLVMVAGLGGGTGSGAAPVLAQMAREKGVFLVSVLLMPFSFEGKRRRAQAEIALEKVACLSDILYCFENDYMEDLFRNRSGARAVFEEVDRVLAQATASVPMLASSPGLINLGLDELATALDNNDSRCLFGSGKGYGPHRAEKAAKAALDSPLISYHNAINYARTVIVHIAGGESMSLHEIRVAMETVREMLADEDVDIFFGTTVKPHLGDEIRVTIIASINSAEFKASLEKPVLPERIAPEAPATTTEQPTPAPAAPAEEVEEEEAAPTQPGTQEDDEQPAPPAADTQEQATHEDTQEDIFSDDDAEEDELPITPDPEDFYPEEEEETARDATLQQGELMPQAATAPRASMSDEEHVARARSLFSEVDEHSGGSSQYKVSLRRRPNTSADEDDLDTPPSLRYNDLRDMFPDN